jgi:E3 ubiquitin-protein transferase RMND5
MEAPLKELAKLEKLTGSSASKGKSEPIVGTLDTFLRDLRNAKAKCAAGELNQSDRDELAQLVGIRKKEIDERQKEIYASMTRIGKALDKVRICSL